MRFEAGLPLPKPGLRFVHVCGEYLGLCSGGMVFEVGRVEEGGRRAMT